MQSNIYSINFCVYVLLIFFWLKIGEVKSWFWRKKLHRPNSLSRQRTVWLCAYFHSCQGLGNTLVSFRNSQCAPEQWQTNEPFQRPWTPSSRMMIRYPCIEPWYLPLVDCMRILTRSVGCAIDNAIAPVVMPAAIRSRMLWLSTTADLPTAYHQKRIVHIHRSGEQVCRVQLRLSFHSEPATAPEMMFIVT